MRHYHPARRTPDKAYIDDFIKEISTQSPTAGDYLQKSFDNYTRAVRNDDPEYRDMDILNARTNRDASDIRLYMDLFRSLMEAKTGCPTSDALSMYILDDTNSCRMSPEERMGKLGQIKSFVGRLAGILARLDPDPKAASTAIAQAQELVQDAFDKGEWTVKHQQEKLQMIVADLLGRFKRDMAAYPDFRRLPKEPVANSSAIGR